ncbi:MAG TPA: thioredoxin family protein [Candidatus Limnocylindria bacterium]|nr:thioredoxin family protein [Candidatus Limnocylindria bacterium]
MTTIARRTFLALLAALALPVAAARAGGDWNDAGIDWQPYEAGLAAAKQQKKPVCLIFYTEWCPHCTNYAKVFHDPAVVAKAKDFVMVRIDKDQNAELSAKYAPDGEYIPRTYFLSSSGALWTDVHAPREKFQYFYDEHDPKSVLAGMAAALAKARQ